MVGRERNEKGPFLKKKKNSQRKTPNKKKLTA